MDKDEYTRRVEKACKDLAHSGETLVKAGQIATLAGIDDDSLLGQRLTYERLDFDCIEVEPIRHNDDNQSNDYRIKNWSCK